MKYKLKPFDELKKIQIDYIGRRGKILKQPATKILERFNLPDANYKESGTIVFQSRVPIVRDYPQCFEEVK